MRLELVCPVNFPIYSAKKLTDINPKEIQHKLPETIFNKKNMDAISKSSSEEVKSLHKGPWRTCKRI